MRKRKSISKALDIAKTMPPLFHKVPGEEFDIKKSEAVKWLLSQPEIANYVFHRITSQGTSNPLIVYNPKTGKWQGVDYHD